MLHLSSFLPGDIVQIADISRAWDVPETFLRKIIARLARAGLVTSYRGNGGGIALARPASELTLLDVIEAAEGELALNACLIVPAVCHHAPWCAAHTVWCDVQAKVREMLAGRTLAELVQQSAHRREDILSPR